MTSTRICSLLALAVLGSFAACRTRPDSAFETPPWLTQCSSEETQRDANAGHRGAIKAIRFAPDGDRVATHSRDGTVRIWDVESGVLSAVFPMAPEADPPVWLDEGRLGILGASAADPMGIVEADGSMKKLTSPDGLATSPKPPAVARKLSAWAWLEGGDVVVAYRERTSGPAIERLDQEAAGFVSVATFDVGSATVVTMHAAKDTLAVITNEALVVWQLATGQRRWAQPGSAFSAVQVAPDGQSVMVGDEDGGLQRYSISDEQILTSYGEDVVVIRDVAVWDDAVVTLGHASPSLSSWSLEDGERRDHVDDDFSERWLEHAVAIARVDDSSFWVARVPAEDPQCPYGQQPIYVDEWTVGPQHDLNPPRSKPRAWPPDGRSDAPWCLPPGRLVELDLEARYALVQAGGTLAVVALPDGAAVELEDSPSTVRFASFAPRHGWIVAAGEGDAEATAWSLSNGSRARSVPLPVLEHTIGHEFRVTLSRSEDRIAVVSQGFGAVFAFPEPIPIAVNQSGIPSAAWFAANDKLLIGRVDGGYAWAGLPASSPPKHDELVHIEDVEYASPDRDGALLHFESSSSNETVVGITLAGTVRVWQGPPAPFRVVELADGRWSITRPGRHCGLSNGTIGPPFEGTP